MTVPETQVTKFDVNAIPEAALKAYALGGYREIEGWGLNDFLVNFFLALDHYQKARAIIGNMFEIGVYHGRVLVLLGLAARREERIAALDIFESLASHNVDHSGPGATKKIVEDHLSRWRLTEKTDFIVGDSLFVDFTKHETLRQVRFAHIDGAHYVDAVTNDLYKTQQAMVPGGIIVVDDYTHNMFTGVNEGCHRFLSLALPRLVIPFAVGSNKLFLTTHSHHADLVAYVRYLTDRPLVRIHGFDAVSITD